MQEPDAIHIYDLFIDDETNMDTGTTPIESTQPTEDISLQETTTTSKSKTPKKKSTNSTRVLLQNALMDEGLRIAQVGIGL